MNLNEANAAVTLLRHLDKTFIDTPGAYYAAEELVAHIAKSFGGTLRVDRNALVDSLSKVQR